MGKRLIIQARGKGSLTYRVRRAAYRFKIKYPRLEGEAEILSLIHSPGHSAPLLKLKVKNEVFYNPAFNGSFVGQKIVLGGNQVGEGNIMLIGNIPVGTKVYNVELNPGDGGKMMRAAGNYSTVFKVYEHNKMSILTLKKKEIIVGNDCRATIGTIAGHGRNMRPFVTAGKKYYKMKARGKKWPRTSAVKMNAIDHPFGSGRGKRIKQKIARKNAPRGTRVGHLRPRRTGRRK